MISEQEKGNKYDTSVHCNARYEEDPKNQSAISQILCNYIKKVSLLTHK